MQTGNLDGQGLAELQNYKFQNLSSAPTTNLTKGRFYFNTSDNTLYVYNGTAWVDALKQGLIYTGGTGIDISGTTISADFTEVATAAQGGLADSAIQPNDNVSELTNDAGYITSASVGDGKTIFQKNGTAFATITANQTSTVNVNYTIPTTASDVGAVPTSRTVNGKALSSNISLTASDVGALPSDTVIGDGSFVFQKNGTAIGTISANQTTSATINYTIPTTASDVGAVPTSRTVNGKALSSNISLTASDVGALPDTTTIGTANTTIQRNGTAIGTINANQTDARTINITVPTTASDVGALPSTTTINDLTSTAQQAALNSGVTSTIVAQVGTNATDIGTINEKIPTQASSSNQLADKEFVNSSISTNTANFIGTFDSVSSLEAYTGDVTNNDYAFVVNSVITNNGNDWTTFSALDNYDKTLLTNFDYAWVVNGSNFDLYRFDILSQEWDLRVSDTPKASVTLNTAYNRYKATVSGSSVTWDWEYTLNNSSFTAAQWAAINSGITSTSVTQIATNTSAISGLSTSKQDKLTAGSNIQINGTTISATDTTYSAGANIQINGTTISATDTTYVAGSGIAINGNTISNTQTSAVWGNITGTLSNQTDLNSVLASKSTVTIVDWTV